MAVIGGTATSAWLGGAVAARAGWRWGFGLALGAVALGWLVAAVRVVPATREALAPRPRSAAAGWPTGDWGAIGAIYLATFGLAVAWSGGVATLLPLYGGRGLGLGADVLGRVLSVAYLVQAALLVPIGWAADILGRLRVLVPGFVVMLAGVLLRAAHPRAARLRRRRDPAGSRHLGLDGPARAARRAAAGRLFGTAAGLYRFVSDLAYVVAPGAVGWLIGRGGFSLAASAMAGLFALAALVSLLALTSPRREH